MEIPPVLAYEYGYRSGADVAGFILNRSVKVTDMTVGSFNDPVTGKSMARTLLNRGTDVIIQIAGNSGIGVIELFKKETGPALLISSDLDIEDEIPGKILTCVMKRFDNAVYGALADIAKQSFKPGYFHIGLKEEAVEITGMRHTKKLVNPEILKKMEELKSFIINGKIKVPSTSKEMHSFDYSSLK